tara:strand:+ start:3875 stop:4150 length:276 start_codon:yes stop_codon:yes gene_type:complete
MSKLSYLFTDILEVKNVWRDMRAVDSEATADQLKKMLSAIDDITPYQIEEAFSKIIKDVPLPISPLQDRYDTYLALTKEENPMTYDEWLGI